MRDLQNLRDQWPLINMLMMLILSCQIEFGGLFQSSFRSASDASGCAQVC